MDREYTLTVNKQSSQLNRYLSIFKEERGTDIYFKLLNCPYVDLKNKKNIYSQIILKSPMDLYNDNIESDITPVIDNKVLFTLTDKIMSKVSEDGIYKLFIILYDDKVSKTILPPIDITINELGFTPSVVSDGVVNEHAIDNSKIVRYGYDLNTYNIDGSYNRTIWIAGDMLSDSKMNKLEQVSNDLNDKMNDSTEKINQLLLSQSRELLIGTKESPVVISTLDTGFYGIRGFIRDFPITNTYELQGLNYYFVTHTNGDYSKILRCLDTEEDFKRYRYNKNHEVVYSLEEEVVPCAVDEVNKYILLTDAKRQKITTNITATIILPTNDEFLEIKLYVQPEYNPELTFPKITWKNQPVVEANRLTIITLTKFDNKWYGDSIIY